MQRAQRMNPERGLSFDDILLVPNQGVLHSRGEANVSSELVAGWKMSIPIISANMPSVTGVDMAVGMLRAGGYPALHRFQTKYEQVNQFESVRIQTLCQSIVSFGLGREEENRVYDLIVGGALLFLLDVAHGDCLRAEETTAWFKENWPDRKLIVGNVATRDGANRLAYSGADAIKVGVGPGAACQTREVTGFGVPQFTAIQNVAELRNNNWYPDLRIIADGGCKNSGDIVKAIAAGADSVMLGRLLAGADEAPEPGVYYGNASFEMNGHHAPEGVHAEIEREGPLEEILKKLVWGIRSGISYAGGTCLKDLRDVEFIETTPQGLLESKVRV